MHNDKITKRELYFILILSTIFALRIFGVFIILPVLTIYAESLQKSNEYLIGIALGIYGITQVIFQLPCGLMADKIGYKPVIMGGLIIFTCGSICAAITNNIWGLIIGRALQGSGAIGSVLIALLLNSVQEQHRLQTMSIVGIIFGTTFASSIILGPIITEIIGLHGLFQGIIILSILTILLAHTTLSNSSFLINSNNYKKLNLISELYHVKQILINKKILKFNFNIFYAHTILMLNFIAIPRIITHLGFIPKMHWKIYIIIILIATCFTLPYIFYYKKKQHNIKTILIVCSNILFLSECIMLMNIQNSLGFITGIQLFFIAFNLIESILPSLIHKASPKEYKGTAISIYSVGQFLGIGCGGFLGGLLLEMQDEWLVLFCASIISIINMIHICICK